MSNRNLKDKVPHALRSGGSSRYPSGMEKKPKCKCLKMDLPNAGKVVVRCEKHRGKPSKKGRMVCYLDADGIVRREDARA